MTIVAGKVYLVGAGPGDPGLLTLRGRECLERADVVVYDQLVNEEILRYAANAETIFVGKRSDRHTLPQDDINRLLIEQARRVPNVVRLKGGDPCVLGRGGEEALALTAAGIRFEVVPGVTAGIAAPEYAGIPVTHRGMSGGVTLLTGHDVDADTNLPETLVRGTLVFYMAVARLPGIVAAVMRAGRANDTPAAVIEWGTLPRQRTIMGTLATIADRCTEARVIPPAVLVVGEVVRLRDPLSWFEARPLYGVRIALTRTRARPSDMAGLLRDHGAEVFEFPTFRVEPTDDAESLGDVTEYDWIVLTSANAVEMLFERLERAGLDARALAGVRLCASGATTVDAVRRRFLRVDAAPERFEAEHVISTMETAESLTRTKILIPRADLARSSLAQAFRAVGADVAEWAAYRAVAAEPTDPYVDRLLRFRPELLVFTSTQAVRGFMEALPPEARETLQSAPVASIGPVTSGALRSHGMIPAVEPAHHEVHSLVEAIVAWAQHRGRGA